MVESKSTKTAAPTGKDLSNAVSLFLKDYAGPVNVSIVTKKIKIEHPNWKLPERRVNKFVKRYMSKEKNPAGADDDASVSTNQYKNEKKASSPSRSLFRMFSSRSKKNNLLSPPDDQLGSSLDTAPEAAPEPVRKEENAEEATPPVGEEVAEETYNPNEEEKLEKESKEEIEQITTEKDNIDKEIAYKTDLDKCDVLHQNILVLDLVVGNDSIHQINQGCSIDEE
ncbi:hypothetical protein FRACYDRAFT_259146 [Fragilariopsis cylindrus CCMP1102]|uniref:Uncharacterized protein n=1 Tax=Fragilariopsis cylindrus CCMP1102 TaxID=635003 RepID=A0A1E7FWV6_9STRA|nr:hypothetical protein FRACYDRAFT_259146 [Fragilariopsis cylindrus CCMP1102]|eukprot:OEU22616.1 hypothetical protein FRACYDRAFT_259146 [Fragilariopsis cylindrus CCMP1102]